MVNQVKGQTFLTVKQHYDSMVSERGREKQPFSVHHLSLCVSWQKRATLRTLDYFYHPLVNTPFTLGIALPQDYGQFRVDGELNPQKERTMNGKFATSLRDHPRLETG